MILGIDPALSITGYGIIIVKDDDLRYIASGEIKTSSKNTLTYRLHKIYSGIRDIIRKYSPNLAVLEEGFYSKNVRIALGLGQARGAAMVACAECGIEVQLYSAREIKLAVTGRGSASKEQVAYMSKTLLGIPNDQVKSFDMSLGAAICAAQKLDMESENV